MYRLFRVTEKDLISIAPLSEWHELIQEDVTNIVGNGDIDQKLYERVYEHFGEIVKVYPTAWFKIPIEDENDIYAFIGDDNIIFHFWEESGSLGANEINMGEGSKSDRWDWINLLMRLHFKNQLGM